MAITCKTSIMHRPETQAAFCLVPTKKLFQPSWQAHAAEIQYLLIDNEDFLHCDWLTYDTA